MHNQQRTEIPANTLFHFAPLHGITDYIFRNIYFRRFPGFDTVLSPFIYQLEKPKASKYHFKDLLPENNTGIPLIPQLMGNDAKNLVAAAKVLASLGYREINLNLGCPFARIANKYRGSGLLPYPERIRKLLEEVCSRLTMAVSVKLRLGRHDPQEILELIPLLNSLPLRNIIIHPRIGTQIYKGELNLACFALAAAASRHPVIYNGDIRNTANLAAIRQQFPGIAGWMIGRAAVADPFLIGRIKTGQIITDPIPQLMEFHDELYSAYEKILTCPLHLLHKMKALWQYFAQSMPADNEELQALFLTVSKDEYLQLIDRIRSNGTWLGLS